MTSREWRFFSDGEGEGEGGEGEGEALAAVLPLLVS